MAGFVEGIDRSQSTLFPALLDDYVAEDNPVRAVDAVRRRARSATSSASSSVQPLDTGRPGYHPGDDAQDLHLRLPQPRAVEPAAGAGVPAQYRADLADRAAGAGLQDHRRFPQGQSARPSARSAASSSRCAASLICSARRASPSTDRSSRRSMRATRTSPRPR